jgi:hypothetical protein
MGRLIIEELKEKVERIRQELLEVQTALDELEQARPGSTASAAPRPHPLANRPSVDKGPLRESFAALFRRLDIEDVRPIGAEKLQELLRQAGIKPEDNLLSSGIIAMREE